SAARTLGSLRFGGWGWGCTSLARRSIEHMATSTTAGAQKAERRSASSCRAAELRRRRRGPSARARLLEQQLEVHLIAATGHTVDQAADRLDRLRSDTQRDERSKRHTDGDADAKAGNEHGPGPL